VVQDRLKRATPETADTAALTAQLERLKDLYQMGDLDRNDYVRRRERLQRQLSQAMPPPIRTLDVERATQLLGDLPTLLDAATPTQRRALLRQVLTSVWIEKFAVTAIKPSANFLLLKERSRVSMAISTGIDPALANYPLECWRAFEIAFG